MPRKNDEFDVRYLGTLYEDLADANRRQEATLKELEAIAIETNALLKSQGEKVTENRTTLKEHDRRIRSVERRQDLCNASTEIGLIKKQLNRLIAFKDMVLSRTNHEDSSIIDLHAQKLQRAIDDAVSAQIPMRILVIKMLPWMIVVFVVGIVLATLVATKVFYNEEIVIPNPRIELKTNSSSLVDKKVK